MSAILPFIKIDSASLLANYFTHYQICWIEAEDPFHQAKRQVFALAEKSVRIGWTFCDGFKNVRKRLRFPNRDYLFATKDWPSALEYMNQVYQFADMLGYTRAVLSHGEDIVKVKSLDPEGHPTSLTEEVKIGYIKFQNGSRIIAFSSNPYAMAVYGGDVGLDEFAKHPNARLLWQTAQARVTWAGDLAVWSSHDGEDTLFNEFVQQARTACPALSASGGEDQGEVAPHESAPTEPRTTEHEPPKTESTEASPPPSDGRGIKGEGCLSSASPKTPPLHHSIPSSPWNLYFRVTMPDAVELGLLAVINRTKGTQFTAEQFITDCRSRAGSEEIYQQSYLCNPLGAASNHIVDWSVIERCRYDYEFIRVHFEHSQIIDQFGEFSPGNESNRQQEIIDFIHKRFLKLFQKKSTFRLGFDVAASGQGNLAVIYIDESKGGELWLRGLFTCRTEDWDFLQTILFQFLRELRYVQAAGDATGLGKQICWEASQHFGSFSSVNFSGKKHDLGFGLMNQLSVAQKRFPRSEQDIAADYFALRKTYQGTRWIFSETRNSSNPASHCDIAWAGALATHAHTANKGSIGVAVIHDSCWFDGRTYHPYQDQES